MRVRMMSALSGKTNEREIAVTLDQIEKWQSGMLIQDAMPNLSADDREFLMTGITPEEWKETFGEGD